MNYPPENEGPFLVRLSALDRALGFFKDKAATPDEVIEMAEYFEKYLTNTSPNA